MESLATRRQEAQEVVRNFVLASTGTALITGPISGTSVMLTGMEVGMVYQIARKYGFYPTLQEAGVSLASLIALSGGLKHLTLEAATALPIIGWWLIKPGIAAGVFRAVGKLAIEHFEARFIEQCGQ